MGDIRKIQSLCRDNDDEMRWLIALISDTGMRLGEAAGVGQGYGEGYSLRALSKWINRI